MKKRIISSVLSTASNTDNLPNVFTINITPKLSERIKALSELVVQNELHAVEIFNYDGIWSNSGLEEPDTGELIRETLIEIHEASVSVDLPTLRVTTDRFFFTATPSESNEEICTPCFDLQSLDDETVLVVFS